MDKIGAAAARREAGKVRRNLGKQYREQLAHMETRLRKHAMKDAQAASRTTIVNLERKLQESERSVRRETERAAKEAARQSHREVEAIKARSSRERTQYAVETARMKSKIDDLSQKLERQTSEQMGEMGEMEVFTALKNAFSIDVIERIGKGMRGADILQKVMVEVKEVGRIVYECKNVSTWQN